MEQTKSFDTSHLIPIPEFLYGFTTCASITPHPNLELVDLDDNQLGVHKISSATTHNIAHPPPPQNSDQNAPTLAWEALYPEGSINPSGPIPGGFGFYLSGPPALAQRLESATEAVFSYRMMLQDGWEWVKGGKLPGGSPPDLMIFALALLLSTLNVDFDGRLIDVIRDTDGGVGALAYGCSGGRQEKRCQCFDLRPMWRPNSVGELYAYLPLTTSNATQLSSVPPLSLANADYGFSVGRGAFHFDGAVSRWISIAFRVKLNDVGSNNGELELWIDGQSVMSTDGLSFRESEEGRIKGMHFQTFFGGHGKEWASPKDQRAWFADVTSVILR